MRKILIILILSLFLKAETQAVIRNHFLRYDRAVRCQVKIITMDMFSPLL
ncbi:transposase domain protein [Streptococcus pneumoniae 459-5]|nr:transposase domain protein [Streptococcus pneumoniae 459-5]